MSELVANTMDTSGAAGAAGAKGTARAARTPSARWALAGLSLAMLLPSLDTSIANASLPTLSRAFGASFPTVQWVALAYLVALTAGLAGAGRLGDVVGRRRLLLVGVAQFTAASALCGAAPTIGWLIAARAAQGLGAAAMLAMTLALASETAPRARTGSAMGLMGTMSAAGTALGPSLGGVLAAAFGWRTIFLVNVPLGLAALVIAARHVAKDRRRERHTAAGGLDLVGALRREPGLAGGLALSALVAMVIMATIVVGPFHLTRALGLDTAHVGFALSVGPLVAALTGVPAGRLVDRFGARRLTRAGLGAMLAGSLALALLPLRLGLAGYLAPLAVLTAGYALFQTANNTAIMSGVSAARRGTVAGLVSLSRNLGLIAGVAGMGAVFAAAVGTREIAEAAGGAVAGGMRVVFLVVAGVVGVGMVVAGRARR